MIEWKKIYDYEVVSFDIFDTLLFRTVANPRDVFEKVWIKAADIALTDISPKEYVKLRMEMERRARNQSLSREVTLADIYAEMPEYIVSDRQAIQEIEVECEKQCCYRNDYIYQWIKQLKHKGKKVTLVSDMYLSKHQIMDILRENGIDVLLFDHIIVSSEEKCTKQTGELYEVLLKQYPEYDKSQIIHIGDNQNADYMQAVQKGIDAIHYQAVSDKLDSIYDFEKIRHNIPQPSILSLRKAVVYHQSQQFKTEIERQAYEIGASIVGPFLTAFVAHVCDRMERLGIHRIYPLMREGYILGKLLEREASSREMNLMVRPIYVSRKVTYIPSIEQLNREEIENMIGARNLTIDESIQLMGLDKSEFMDIQQYGNLRWKETHKIKFDDNTLKEVLIQRFLLPQNIKMMERYVEEQRMLLVNYLKQEIKDFDQIATIDVGFFGRIQMWMEKALDLEGVPHKMKHFLAVGVTGDKIYNGLDFEGYYGTIVENSDLNTTIHRTTDIIEKFISVTEGSTIGYKKIEGEIQPVKSEPVNNDLITHASFAGILDYQNAFMELCQKKKDIRRMVLENRRGSLQIMHRLIDMPRLTEVKLIQQVEADTNFGTNYKKSIITQENIQLMQEKGVDFIDKCNVSYTYQNSSIVWPKGVVTLGDPYYYVRRALKNNAGNEIAKSMQEVVEQVQQDGVTEIALYGAGENGRQFYFICSLYNIKVKCFIDRKESIWGTRKEGIEVMGLKDAMRQGNDKFIITSLFSISEIEDYIKEQFGDRHTGIKIYSV